MPHRLFFTRKDPKNPKIRWGRFHLWVLWVFCVRHLQWGWRAWPSIDARQDPETPREKEVGEHCLGGERRAPLIAEDEYEIGAAPARAGLMTHAKIFDCLILLRPFFPELLVVARRSREFSRMRAPIAPLSCLCPVPESYHAQQQGTAFPSLFLKYTARKMDTSRK